MPRRGGSKVNRSKRKREARDRVGDRVAVRVAKALRKPRTTFAMFEKADEPTNRMEAP